VKKSVQLRSEERSDWLWFDICNSAAFQWSAIKRARQSHARTARALTRQPVASCVAWSVAPSPTCSHAQFPAVC